MRIQVNTDNHIQGSKALTLQVESVVEDALRRFTDRITRVEVHLTDEDSKSKSGDDDIRCVMEARLAGLQPIAVSERSDSMEQAISGAAEKLEKAITRTLGRRDDRKPREVQ